MALRSQEAFGGERGQQGGELDHLQCGCSASASTTAIHSDFLWASAALEGAAKRRAAGRVKRWGRTNVGDLGPTLRSRVGVAIKFNYNILTLRCSPPWRSFRPSAVRRTANALVLNVYSRIATTSLRPQHSSSPFTTQSLHRHQPCLRNAQYQALLSGLAPLPQLPPKSPQGSFRRLECLNDHWLSQLYPTPLLVYRS